MAFSVGIERRADQDIVHLVIQAEPATQLEQLRLPQDCEAGLVSHRRPNIVLGKPDDRTSVPHLPVGRQGIGDHAVGEKIAPVNK